MPYYLLAAHGSTEPPAEPRPQPTPEQMQEMMAPVMAFEEEMRAAGALVFSGALHAPDTATVVRDRDGEAVTTDGPFAESKAFLAGLYLLKADDLDEALGWAHRTSALVGAPIEVRPFHDHSHE